MSKALKKSRYLPCRPGEAAAQYPIKKNLREGGRKYTIAHTAGLIQAGNNPRLSAL